MQPLKDLTEFIELLCTAITELIFDQITASVIDSSDVGSQALIGVVEHYFPKANACLVRATGIPVEVGINVVARGRNRSRPSSINSIQIDDVPHQSILPKKDDELGIRFPIELSPGTRLYRLDKIPPVNALLDCDQFVE